MRSNTNQTSQYKIFALSGAAIGSAMGGLASLISGDTWWASLGIIPGTALGLALHHGLNRFSTVRLKSDNR